MEKLNNATGDCGKQSVPASPVRMSRLAIASFVMGLWAILYPFVCGGVFELLVRAVTLRAFLRESFGWDYVKLEATFDALFWLCPVFALAGLVMGIMAHVAIARSHGTMDGKALACFGIAISLLVLYLCYLSLNAPC